MPRTFARCGCARLRWPFRMQEQCCWQMDDIETGHAALPAAPAQSRRATPQIKVAISEANKTVLEAASRTRALVNALRFPFDRVAGKFVGKLGDLAVQRPQQPQCAARCNGLRGQGRSPGPELYGRLPSTSTCSLDRQGGRDLSPRCAKAAPHPP